MSRRYAPLSREHRFWLRLFPKFLAPRRPPSGVLRALHGALVVPNVVFITGSAEYQAYLAKVFHRSTLARVGHFVCVPLGAILLVATAQRLAPKLGIVVASLLVLLWVGVAIAYRRPLWAAVNLLVGAAIAAVGLRYPANFVHPALPMLLVAMLQSASHTTEAEVPPRVGDRARWTSTRDYVTGPGLVVGGLRGIRQWLFGTFDEWWATPRLVHVGTLFVMFRLGYAKELRARLDGWVDDAVSSGDPALDYIGEGGGTYLDPATLEPAE